MNLRGARERAALSIAELAAQAGVHPVVLWRAETGRTAPRPRTRRKLAQALGIEPAAIEWQQRKHGVDKQ